MLRAAGYIAGLAAFLAILTGIEMGSIRVPWHSYPYRTRDLLFMFLAASFPIACLIDFGLRKKPALPNAILWPLRIISFLLSLWVNAVIYLFRGPLAS